MYETNKLMMMVYMCVCLVSFGKETSAYHIEFYVQTKKSLTTNDKQLDDFYIKKRRKKNGSIILKNQNQSKL